VRQSLYAKIFLWFCATVAMTLVVTLASAALMGAQPFGRRWMALTQDLYAHTAVDLYTSGGCARLQQYLDTLGRSSTVQGQLLDDAGHDVLGRPQLAEGAAVVAEATRTGGSAMRLGRVWSAASPVSGSGRQYTFVMVVHPTRDAFDGTFARSLLPRVALGMVLVALCCLLLARHITRPILVLERAATELAEGSLTVRALPRMAGRKDELARMASAFDHMAERIQRLIQTQQEMLGHISHELRSPLTRIGVSLELLRRGDVESLDQMQADLDRLNEMIGQILELTRMDLQQDMRVAFERVDLRDLLRGIAQDAAFEARERGQPIDCKLEADCVVMGDRELLRSCCENIVRNALLYTPPGTAIRMALGCTAGAAEILIEDEGDGVRPRPSRGSLRCSIASARSQRDIQRALASALPLRRGSSRCTAERFARRWFSRMGLRCASRCPVFCPEVSGDRENQHSAVSEWSVRTHSRDIKELAMNMKLTAAAGIVLLLPLTLAHAQKTVTGRHGSTATSTVTRNGATVHASGTATGARGNTASGSATATRTRTGTTDTGTVTGPKGGTSTVSGTTTNNGTSTTANGTVTGPRGNSKTGTVTVPR
jgi:two-component system sensor histidine kinase CpxA